MSLDITTILGAVESHAVASGYFRRVNLHEPKSAPAKQLEVAIWANSVDPAPRVTGLQSTSSRIGFQVRIYKDMVSEPQDMIDSDMLEALDYLMAAYSGDFTLGGSVMQVDLLGAHGVPLRAQAGYLNQDGRLFRVYTITLPLIVIDLWTQTA